MVEQGTRVDGSRTGSVHKQTIGDEEDDRNGK